MWCICTASRLINRRVANEGSTACAEPRQGVRLEAQAKAATMEPVNGMVVGKVEAAAVAAHQEGISSGMDEELARSAWESTEAACVGCLGSMPGGDLDSAAVAAAPQPQAAPPLPPAGHGQELPPPPTRSHPPQLLTLEAAWYVWGRLQAGLACRGAQVVGGLSLQRRRLAAGVQAVHEQGSQHHAGGCGGPACADGRLGLCAPGR